MTEMFARPAVQLAARVLAVVGVIATGFYYFLSVLIAPLPWPWVFGLVWLGFVIATILAARRWAYRPLVLPVMSLVLAVVAIWIGETFFRWAP